MSGKVRPGEVKEVVVRSDGVTVDRVVPDAGEDVGVLEARRRFGGIDVPATLAGTAAALGTAMIIGVVLSSAGRVGYEDGAGGDRTLSTAGLVLGFATLLVSFLVGGWVAGRMARYDGGRNGLTTGVWFIVSVSAASVLYPRLGLPQWLSDNEITVTELGMWLAAIAALLAAAWWGGLLGERYHGEADALIAQTRRGGVGRIERRPLRRAAP